jgi:3-oxoadipate enol-lactonase
MPAQTHAIDSQGAKLNVEVEGPDDAPVLMLSNSLGTNLHMWETQVPAFTKHFRLVRYDSRGHGKSAAPKGPYSIEMLGRDAIAIMDALKLKTVNWCGLSKGGMVGMWLGTNAPERIDRLVLSNTASQMAMKEIWTQRIEAVQKGGMAAIADGTVERWFTKGFREKAPDKIAPVRAMLLSTPPQGYIGCCEAIREMDQGESIRRITAPTLIIGGKEDPATTMDAAKFMHERIKGSKLVALDAAHISNIEQPQAYTDAVLGHVMQKVA